MISPSTIQTIRERTDIVALVGETVKLQRRGRSWVGLCPFHQEKSPSFHVSQERGFFHCFGCKESGSVFDFLMKVEGLSFREAALRLAERAGVAVEELGTDAERREAEAARRAQDDLYGVNAVAAHWFETQLREHRDAHLAVAELERRGLSLGDDALQAFRVGYAPSGWDGLTSYLRQQGISPVAAEKVRLIAPRKSGSGYYDFFRNRLMFAILDVQGRVVGFSGRILPDPQTGLEDKTTGKYVNSPESPVYKKGETLFGLYQARQTIRQREEAVLVEGNFDVVSLHARGITNVVAPLGTAFTTMQAKLLRRFSQHVVLLFDGDAAGRKATREARETCREAGLSAKVAMLPEGKDPDELAKERGPDGVRATIAAARDILTHLIDTALDQTFDVADAHERAERVRQIAQLVASEDDPTVRAMAQTYVNEIAQRLGFGSTDAFRAMQQAVQRALSAEMAKARHSEASSPARGTTKDVHEPPRRDISVDPPWRAHAQPQHEDVALAVVGCFLDFPALLDDPAAAEAIDYLEGAPALAIAALRQAASQDGAVTAEVLALVPASLHTFAARRLAAPRHESADEARVELLSNAQKLKRLGLSREKAEAVEALHQVGRAGDAAAEDALLRDLFAARVKRGL